MVWVLQTKKKVKRPLYQARFLDGDSIAMARPALALVPQQEEYEPGARLHAMLRLPDPMICRETAKVIVGKTRTSAGK